MAGAARTCSGEADLFAEIGPDHARCSLRRRFCTARYGLRRLLRRALAGARQRAPAAGRAARTSRRLTARRAAGRRLVVLTFDEAAPSGPGNGDASVWTRARWVLESCGE